MPQITLILHNIRSTYNVGAIFRTAEGLAVEKIILSGYTPYPTYPSDPRLPHEARRITNQIHKVALGAETMVPFERYEDLNDWMNSNTMPLVALEQSPDSIPLADYTPPEQFALILGEEVTGVEPGLLLKCDDIIEIPMQGQKESFNVSVAAGIAVYALTS